MCSLLSLVYIYVTLLLRLFLYRKNMVSTNTRAELKPTKVIHNNKYLLYIHFR